MNIIYASFQRLYRIVMMPDFVMGTEIALNERLVATRVPVHHMPAKH